jgi:signal transduction histidine kinase
MHKGRFGVRTEPQNHLTPAVVATVSVPASDNFVLDLRMLAETADTSIVEIRDHGPGISEELLSHIFKPFFRVEESRDTNSGGIGLGLSIAMRAVQVHQGTITAENAKPGLKVQIVLPRLSSTEKVAMQTLDKPISV